VENVQGKQAVATSSVQKPGVAEESKVEAVGEVLKFESPPCNVGFSLGMTLNLGNYESVKVSVSLNVPCQHAEIDEIFEFAKGWVDDKLTEVRQEIQQTQS